MAITRKPRVGDRIDWPASRESSGSGVVTSVEGNLCWVLEDGREKAQPFIWQFRDGLNTYHTIREA
jgi:hypothetical protein